MKLNINDTCMVTLTASGAVTYNKWEAQFENLKYTKPNYKQAGEVVEAQLWHLFQVFGSSIHLGGDVPFVQCIITLKD
jgi:hypothetical protein